jgi:hypothetical protein
MRKFISLIAAVAALAIITTGCASKASVAAQNLSTAADNFQVPRSISFYNGITGQNILLIKGLCSIGSNVSSTDPPVNGGDVTVTCDVGKDAKGHDEFIKDFLGLSDNVTYVVQQEIGVPVSDAHYQFIWRPSTLVPGITVQ